MHPRLPSCPLQAEQLKKAHHHASQQTDAREELTAALKAATVAREEAEAAVAAKLPEHRLEIEMHKQSVALSEAVRRANETQELLDEALRETQLRVGHLLNHHASYNTFQVEEGNGSGVILMTSR